MANWVRHAWDGISALADRMTWYANNIPNFATLYDSTNNEGIIRISQTTNADTFDFYPKAEMTDGYVRFTLGSLGSTTGATFSPTLAHNNTSTTQNFFGTTSASRVTGANILPTEASCKMYMDTLSLSNDDLLIRFTYEQVRVFGLIAILHGQDLQNNTTKNFLFTSCSRTTSTSYISDFMEGRSLFITESGYWTQADATINNVVPYTNDATANVSLLTNYLLEEHIVDGITSKIYKIYGPNAIQLPPFVPMFINNQEYMTLGQGLVIKIEYD